MERVAQLAAHFNVPAMMCVNKYDLNREQTQAIEKFAVEKNVSVLGRIPFDPVFTRSMVQGQTLFEYHKDSESGQAIGLIWNSVKERLGLN